VFGQGEGGRVVHEVLHHLEALTGLEAGRVELVELDPHVGSLGHLAALGRFHVVAVQLKRDRRTRPLKRKICFESVPYTV